MQGSGLAFDQLATLDFEFARATTKFISDEIPPTSLRGSQPPSRNKNPRYDLEPRFSRFIKKGNVVFMPESRSHGTESAIFVASKSIKPAEAGLTASSPLPLYRGPTGQYWTLRIPRATYLDKTKYASTRLELSKANTRSSGGNTDQ